MRWKFCPDCGEPSQPRDVYCAAHRIASDIACRRNAITCAKRKATTMERFPNRYTPEHAVVFWQQKAQATVTEARKRGLLPELDGSIACTDCDKPAQQYDHRDYSRALDVEPVCRSCNLRRGTAKWPQPSDYRFKPYDQPSNETTHT